MKYLIFTLSAILFLTISCSNNSNEVIDASLYQKELPFNGLKGKIDSIKVTSYLVGIDNNQQIIEQETSHFDVSGFVSQKCKVNFKEEKEFRHETTIFKRTGQSLKKSFSRNVKETTRSLLNETTLLLREDGREIWQTSAIVDGEKLDNVSSSSYHYGENSLVYLTENKEIHHHEHGETCEHELDESLTPVYEITYNQMKLPHHVKFFGSNNIITTFYEYYYNESGFLTKTTARYAKVSTALLEEEAIVESEAIGFIADDIGNPKEIITLFRNGQKQKSIYEIYYRK